MERADLPDGKREKKMKTKIEKLKKRVFDKMTTIRQRQAMHQRHEKKKVSVDTKKFVRYFNRKNDFRWKTI